MQTVQRKPITRCGALVAMTLLACAFGAAAAYATDQRDQSITLNQAVHFTDLKGQDRVVGPGEYRVEVASKSGLTLTPTDGKEPIVLSGRSYSLPSPYVFYDPVSNDEHHLIVLLPNGEGVQVIGSPSGIQSREIMITPYRPAQRRTMSCITSGPTVIINADGTQTVTSPQVTNCRWLPN